jgi:predicted nucleic acid-binding protein
MIFVDTGAWYARIVPSEIHHSGITGWLKQNTQPLLTTDYVVDETLTLLKARGQAALAFAFGDLIFRGELASFHVLTEQEIRLSWETFRRYTDKDWSFTDCTCKVVMEKRRINMALALDEHFRQFGTVTVVP